MAALYTDGRMAALYTDAEAAQLIHQVYDVQVPRQLVGAARRALGLTRKRVRSGALWTAYR
jgi:hypothetical protein